MQILLAFMETYCAAPVYSHQALYLDASPVLFLLFGFFFPLALQYMSLMLACFLIKNFIPIQKKKKKPLYLETS